MDPWLEDVIEQLCISQSLIDAKLDSGKRLAIILIDNAIEFMLKAYGDTKLVGKRLSKTNWEAIKAKRDFNLLMNKVLPNSPCSIQAGTVNPYHDTRNTLYHKALPLSIERSKVAEYLKIAKQMLSELFGVQLEEKEWSARTASVKDALLGKQQLKLVVFSKTEENLVKIETSGVFMKNTEAILLGIYGLVKQLGRAPTKEELNRTLNYSGKPVEQLSSQIYQLRSHEYITKGKLSLRPKARRSLIRKFALA